MDHRRCVLPQICWYWYIDELGVHWRGRCKAVLELHLHHWLHLCPSCQQYILAEDWHSSHMDLLQGCYDRSSISISAMGFLFQLLLRRSKDGWCVDGTSCFLFSLSAKKACAFLPLADTHFSSPIACTAVFPVLVVTSSFSLINLFPLRLPIQPSIFIHSFLPSYLR